MHWYYAAQGRQSAPFDEAELPELVRAGVIRPDTLVWREGLDTWTPYSQLAGPAPPPMPIIAVGSGNGVCAECGRVFPLTELVALGAVSTCAACKPRHLQRLREGGHALLQVRYGGFWIRFVARIIDSVALSIVGWIIQIPVLFMIPTAKIQNPAELATGGLAVFGVLTLLNLVIALVYETYFLTTRGATPGKMAFGLKVIRTDGEKISKGLAIGRYFAQWVSSMTLTIGYIMAGFDEEKRALHDRICDTRVVFHN